MAHKKVISFFVFFTVAIGLFAQQEGQYSQYMFNHLAVNPAYAGSREVLKLNMLVRKQWVAIDGAPNTTAFNLQAPLRKKRVGLAVELGNESIGPKELNSVKFSYAYRIKLFTGKLSFGLRANFMQYATDWRKIKYKDPVDDFTANNVERIGIFGTDFGMYYHTKVFYWGACITNLNQPEYIEPDDDESEGSSGLGSNFVRHLFSPIGAAFKVSDKLVVNPSLMIKAVKGAPLGVDVNCNFLIADKIWLGASVRRGYGIAALMMWNITEKIKAGYSYDHGLNRIGTLGKSSHELVLTFDFNVFKTKTITPRYL
jgi:type IX secretion system PorP/SprF family membrane protein